MKNILVTGGAGFIGSHTAVELIAAGYNAVIVDNLSNSKESALTGIKEISGATPSFYNLDYSNDEKLKEIILKESVDGVIHFAAFKAVGESTETPLKYYANNVAGFVGLLSTLEKLGIPIVFSSSCTVYGEPDSLPVNEQAPIKPAESPYGTTKQMDETILRDATKASKKLKSIALRYFNPVGAHPSGLIGELPLGRPSNLFPVVTQAIAGVGKELTVFGTDYDTPDGSCVRDYIHVVDLAKAHIKALEYLNGQQQGFYDVFNIGSGKGNTVLEVIKAFEETTGKKVPHILGARRDGDIVATYANCSKANELLGWKTEKTLTDSCRDAWNWQTKITPAL
ncbi:MAG: UDP-galactose-4-epimerase [Candidatus Saccharibacteria bacterium]|nr:UDP-galactose-4-epimerase [Candidatus Saccharibacteria bacterium]